MIVATFQEIARLMPQVWVCVHCNAVRATEAGAGVHEHLAHDGAQTVWPVTWCMDHQQWEFEDGSTYQPAEHQEAT